MFNFGNQIQEIKNTVNCTAGHPKSAPNKKDPEPSEDKHNYGGHIYKMHQGEDAYTNKKLQQTAYFLDLARQIQEKTTPKPQPPSNNSITSNEILAKPTEISKFLPEPSKDPEIRYSRYQKKYEIENHTKIGVATSQVLGGVLQRDDAYLNKLKKIQQQQEMKEFLALQMQEKLRLKEEEKKRFRNSEIEEFRQSVEVKPEKNFEKSSFLMENQYENTCKSTTMPLGATEKKNEKDESNYGTLSEFYRQLSKETEELCNIFTEKEKQIRELEQGIIDKKKEAQRKLKNESKIGKNEESLEKIESKRKIEGIAVGRPSSLHENTGKRVTSKAKLSAVDERLEIVRKRRIENSKIAAQAKLTKNAEAFQKRENLPKSISLRDRKAISPIPQTPETELETVAIIKDTDQDRHNLDTAGRSCFIYPDSKGNFKINDEIDKFLMDYQRKGSPIVSHKSHNLNPALEAKFSLSAMTFTNAKIPKPLVAKSGFPIDIFKYPSNDF